MLVVGEKDMAARVVSPRTRGGGAEAAGKDQQQAAVALDEFAVRLREEAKMPAFASSGAPRGITMMVRSQPELTKPDTTTTKEKEHPKAI